MNQNRSKKDHQLRNRALLVWWFVSFLFVFIIAGFVMPREEFYSSSAILKKALAAAIAAIPLDLALYYYVLPRLNQQHKICKEILQALSANGMTEELALQMDEQLAWCKKREMYSSYANLYATYLAAYHVALGNLPETGRYLEEIDEKSLFANQDTIAVQRSITQYYMIKTIYLMKTVGLEKAANQIAVTENAFKQYYGKDEAMDLMIDNYYLDYDVMCGKYEEAQVLIDRYLNHELFRFTALLAQASISRKRDDEEKMQESIAQIEAMDVNEYYQKVLEAWKQRKIEC